MLFSGTKRSLATEVHHCEFVNGHDVYLFGDSMRFHHNLVDNFNDDGLALINDTTNIRIHENVVTNSHTALSFDGERIGPVWIYRNLFDTRQPTLGNRPPAPPPPDMSLRTGVFYKDGKTDGPIDFFHNTCLVRTPGMTGIDDEDIMRAAYTLHRDQTKTHIRRTFNNIFASANYDPEPKQPLAFLPQEGFGPSDGNCYYRFREDDDHTEWFWAAGKRPRDDFNDYQDEQENEHRSEYADPGFLTIDPQQPEPVLTDDLRLRDGGGAAERGVRLDDVAPELWDLDKVVTGEDHSPAEPDAGCYARPTFLGITLPLPPGPLKVGVKARHHYP